MLYPDQSSGQSTPVRKLFKPLGGPPVTVPPSSTPSLTDLISTNQPYDQTHVPVNPNIYPDEPDKRFHIIIIAILYLILVIVVSASLFALAVTYHYINIRNPEVSEPISRFVHSLPFMP